MGKGGNRKSKGKPDGLPHASLYGRSNGRNHRGYPKSTSLNAGDLVVTANWALRPWKPACMRSNYSGAVTEAVQVHCRSRPVIRRPPASFRLPKDATLKGAPAPHAPGHITHDPCARPHDSAPCADSDGIFPRGVPYY